MVKKYRKPFLKEVIVRLDYSHPIAKLVKTIPKRLMDIVSPLFPISEPKQFIGKEFLVTKDATKEETLVGTTWLFHDSERQKTLTISGDNVNISYKKYDSFDILKSEFLPVVEELFSSYDDFQGKRLGLRYINDVTLSGNNLLDWRDYLDEKLLTGLSFPKDPSKICRVFTNLELNYGDSIIRFQYGMFNVDYPSPIRKKSFLLDYDASYQGPQNLADIKHKLDRFNEIIKVMFEQSISDRLRSLME